jgi:hypothetical protein
VLQVSDSSMKSEQGRRPRRRLAASEKYEIWVSVLTGQATQRQAADLQGALDALAASVPGRPGVPAERAAVEAARAEVERLRATVTEQAVELHLHRGKARWD